MAEPPDTDQKAPQTGLADIPDLLNTQEVAKLLRVKPCTVRNERKRGKLQFKTVGAHIFHTPQQVADYLRDQEVKPCANQETSQGRAKSANTGSLETLAGGDETMPGAEPGTMKQLSRLAVQALARQTFARRGSSSPSGSPKAGKPKTAPRGKKSK